LPMHSRPQGKLLIAALLGNGVKTVLVYDGKRVGRTQPAYWSFIGICRDNGIAVVDCTGVDLGNSVMGGVNGMLAEMDRDATVKRLAEGKRLWRGKRRVDGRWPYGEHPHHDYDSEREIVKRIAKMRADGVTLYGIRKQLNAEGLRTRTGSAFSLPTIIRVLARLEGDVVSKV